MVKKILLCLTILFSLCITVCAEDLSYDFLQKRIDNTGNFAVVKSDDGLYFSGEEDYVEVELEKGSKITLLRWNSYRDIRPLAEPAVYTLYEINYVCDGVLAGTSYGFKDCEIKTPAYLQKNGYAVKWTVTEKSNYVIVAQAEYELIDYKVSFVADGQEVACPTYNINNQIVTEPAVPRKAGYSGKWESYNLTYGDKVVNAVYTPIDYTITFESESGVVKKTFNVENMSVEAPEVPVKTGYTVRWEDYTLSLNNITVKAIYEANEYEISFVVDGENVATEKYTIENMKVNEPSVPEKDGYTGKWESYELILSDITVNAVYTPIEYKVTFKAENFTEVKTFTVENMNVEEPSVPEKSGYTGKWEEYTLNLSDLIVNAVYTPNQYIVTFDCTDDKVEVTYGGKYPALPTPANNDISRYFDGWYMDEILVEAGDNVEITNDVCLVAKWAKKPVYKVTYNNYYEDGTSVSEDVIEGQKAIKPETPVNPGFRFINWQTDLNEVYDFNTPVTGDINLSPKWELIEFKAIFKADDVTVATEIFTVDDMSVNEPSVPEKTGYTGKWEEYSLSLSDLTVNAVYTPNQYIVTFDCVEDVLNVTYGEKYQALPIPENSDVSEYFIGWYIGEMIVAEGNKIEITENVCLVAKWAKKPVYEVTYKNYYQDGSSMIEAVIEGEKAIMPTQPTRPGYTFVNWQTESGEVYDFDNEVNENITLCSDWEVVEYTVNFKADGVCIETREFTVENMDINEPDVPEKEGYTGEWEDYTLSLSDLTVNAVYTPNQYNVTFDCAEDKVEVTYGGKYPYLPIPENNDVSVYFAGWYMGETLIQTGDDVKITSDVCLVAKWEKKPVYKVTYKNYYEDGTSISEDIIEGQKVFAPAEPTKLGYKFVKWQTKNGDDYNFGNAVTENVELYPKWEIIKYTVTFKVEGNIVGVENYTIENKVITEPEIPVKPGYTKVWENYTLTYGNVEVNAIYTPEIYHVYFMNEDGTTFAIVDYTVENRKIIEPEVPDKMGYTGKWQEYSLDIGDVTVYPQYTIINYKVTFMAEGNVVSVENYTITNNQITEPTVPQKAGYTVQWSDYSLSFYDCVVKAIYTPIEYTVTFKADGVIVDEEKYTIENKVVYAPSIPGKSGYTAKWETFDLNLEDLTVNAIYTPIEYTITFIADGKQISVQKYTVENKNVTQPEIPVKAGCTAKWEDYSLDLTNKNVKVIYTPIEYIATFKADGVIVGQEKFTIENMSVNEPGIPVKPGYTATWENYTLKLEDITINAVYKGDNYTITFMADGKIISTQNFSVENSTINEPTVPQKEWYDGRWEAYTLGEGNVTVNAIYTLATYTISFVADGVEIGTQTYNKNNQTVSLPAIPSKANHRAVWEKYEIVPGGMTINVRYISKETDEENAIEKLRYASMIEHFKKHNFTGYERIVVENVQKVGASILEDIEYGIIITEQHIKEQYADIILESKEIYQNISNKDRFKIDVMRLFKNDKETYEYFEEFAEKYL